MRQYTESIKENALKDVKGHKNEYARVEQVKNMKWNVHGIN